MNGTLLEVQQSQQNLWMKIKEKASKSDTVECLSCRPTSGEEKEDEAYTDRKQTFSGSDPYWRFQLTLCLLERKTRRT